MDADLAAFYRGLTQEQLDRTAVITVADHGLTMGLNYMYAQEGRVSCGRCTWAWVWGRGSRASVPGGVGCCSSGAGRPIGDC